MKVLLINSNRFVKPWPVIPFGLCRVAAAVDAAGHQVQVLDLCFSKNPAHDIERCISSWDPDVLGITIRNIDNCDPFNSTFFLEEVNQLIVEPCKRFFKGPIVIGGPAVGISGAEILEFLDLEYAIRGDGEAAIVEFLQRLELKQSFTGMRGLVWRKEGVVREDNPPMIVEDLDALPPPKPHQYLDLRPYLKFNAPLQIQTKRGCPLNCSYCTYNQVEGLRYRLRSPELVADEIEELVSQTGVNQIEFVDSTFNIPLGHAKAVLRAVLDRRLDVHMSTMGINPSAIDDELVDLLKAAKFNEVHLGIESLSDVTLKALGKNFDKQQAVKAIDLLQTREIPFIANMILGSPQETRESLRETLDAAARHIAEWNMVLINIGVRVYNGSPIAQDLQRADPSCTDDNFLRPAGVAPEAITFEEVEQTAEQMSRRHPNVFVELKDTKSFPVSVVKTACYLLKKLAPHQPIWRVAILLRRIRQTLGPARIQRLFWERQSSQSA